MRRLAIGDHGTDVTHLQQAINARRHARGLPTIHVDGRFDASWRHEAERMARALGAREDTIARHPLTVGIQRIIRWPNTRTPLQLQRARDRANIPTLPSVMYDSIYVSEIPKNAEAVAGYVGGQWPTYADLAAAFPKAKRVSIAVASYYNADILDIEPGDAPPEKAAAWMKRQFDAGATYPGVYCSVSTAQEVITFLAQAGISRDRYRLWTAHYTEVPHICDKTCGFGFTGRADATQWTSHALGRTLDESMCSHRFWRAS